MDKRLKKQFSKQIGHIVKPMKTETLKHLNSLLASIESQIRVQEQVLYLLKNNTAIYDDAIKNAALMLECRSKLSALNSRKKLFKDCISWVQSVKN